MANDDASFKTSKEAISLELILLIFFVGMPSTTYKGVRSAPKVPIPLIIKEGEAPGTSVPMTWTPAAFPCMACVAFNTLDLVISPAVSWEIAPVLSVFFRLP